MVGPYLVCWDEEDRKAVDHFQDIVKFDYSIPLAIHTKMIVHTENKNVEMAHEIASKLLKNTSVCKHVYIGNAETETERTKALKSEIFKMALIAVHEVGIANKEKKIQLLTSEKTEKYWCDLLSQNTPIKENYSQFQQIFGRMIASLL